MNRILFIIIALLYAQGLSAQTNILRDWKIKYNAPLMPEKVKYHPGSDSLHVAYKPQVVVDTVSVFYDSIPAPGNKIRKVAELTRFQRRMKIQTTRAFTRDLVKQTDSIIMPYIEYYHITDAGGLVLVLGKKDKKDANYMDINVGSGRTMHNLIDTATGDDLKRIKKDLDNSIKKYTTGIDDIKKTLDDVKENIIKLKGDTTPAAKENLKKAMDDSIAIEKEILTLNDKITECTHEKGWIAIHGLNINNNTYIFTDTALSLREIKNTTVGSLDPSNFYVGIFYTPSAAFRSITIEDPQFSDLDALNDRHDAETNRYGHAVSLQLGYNYGRHTVYGEYLHLRQGFNATNQVVDWQTGLPVASAGQRKYVFSGMGFGIGYNYSGYEHFVNAAIELGAYYNFFDIYYQDTTTFTTGDIVKQYTNSMRAAGLRKNVFGVKAGVGLSLRPTFRWEIKLMPTIHYNLTPANNGTLETRLYNVGLTMGVGWRIGTKANGKIYY